MNHVVWQTNCSLSAEDLDHMHEIEVQGQPIHRARLKAKKQNSLVSGNAGDEKNLHPAGHKFIFLTNLVQFVNKSLHLRTALTAIFIVEKQSPTFYCSKRKKRKFAQINFLVENCLNDKFY